MYKFLVVFALLSSACAQTLTLSPFSLGNSAIAGPQVINLGRGGGLGAVGFGGGRIVGGGPVLLGTGGGLGVRGLGLGGRLIQPRPIVAAFQPVVRPVYTAPLVQEQPQPYQFGYQSSDEYGTQLGRQESADGSGTVTGSYSYQDASGLFRTVEYIADAGGFRATVKTNEPGTANSNPADVIVQSSAAQ